MSLPGTARTPLTLLRLIRRLAPDGLGLGALFLVQVWLLRLWLALDALPPSWDQSLLLWATNDWRRFFVHPSVAALTEALTLRAWKTTPGWLTIMGLAQTVAGRDADLTTWISGSLALGLLIAFTYGIGRELFGRLAGTAAAVIVCLYAATGDFARTYLFDLPLAATVAGAQLGLARLTRPTRARVMLSWPVCCSGLPA